MLKMYLSDFMRYRYLLYNLISRDFKLKYRRSLLGVAWSVLNPLLMCTVMFVIFGSLMPQFRGSGIENYAVYLVIGQLLFNFFRDSTTMAMSSIMNNAMLLRKVYIPKYIFPLQKICFGLVNCLFSFIALVLVMLFTGAPLYWTALLAVYPLLMLALFSLGVGMILSALTVFFRDVMHLWEVFTTILMWFSAIFYAPEQFGNAILVQLIELNPIYQYITAFRTLVMDGQLLSGGQVLVCAVWALVMLTAGVLVFKKTQDSFVLYM
ncbi:MAG: ABC transporter permease [Candidatus Fournierella pullistercoris]|uniref:Transport permease protein n=1 Tax=Candidatus Allofournierella pullistercoris TaxID=2838597 RepID=A0A948WPC5_9FIRM|nr:ABC transporter permease [Candidatus Fournierella pullistercoris]